MYKWPQGRVIRTICLIVALIIGADLVYNGGIVRFLTLQPGGSGYVRVLTLGIIFTVAGACALIAGVVAAGFHPRAVDFLIDVEGEMVKVEWPKPNALVKATLIIAVAVAILAGIIFLVDLLVYYFIQLLISLKVYF